MNCAEARSLTLELIHVLFVSMRYEKLCCLTRRKILKGSQAKGMYFFRYFLCFVLGMCFGFLHLLLRLYRFSHGDTLNPFQALNSISPNPYTLQPKVCGFPLGKRRKAMQHKQNTTQIHNKQ